MKYLWTAYFEDGKIMEQKEDGSLSYEEVIEYQEKAKLIYIDLNDGTFAYGIDLPTQRFGINGTWFQVGDSKDDTEALTHVQPVVKHKKDHYLIGFSGINGKGHVVDRVIRIV